MAVMVMAVMVMVVTVMTLMGMAMVGTGHGSVLYYNITPVHHG